MGAQQSTRRLTLDNDDPTNVIKVSDAVVDRLKGKAQASNDGGSVPVPTSATSPQGPVHATPIPTTPTPAVAVPISPVIRYIQEPYQTALQMRHNTETALKRNDEYWQQRINKLEENHQHINKLMEKEYCDAVNEVQSHFSIKEPTRKVACQAGKKAVMDCYKKHPTEPMRCANEVRAFSECVDRHRTEIISKRG